MILTFSIHRTKKNKFRVSIFKEDTLVFLTKHIEVVDTLEEAIQVAEDRKNYKKRPDDGFDDDEDRWIFFKNVPNDDAALLMEACIYAGRGVVYNIAVNLMDEKEFDLLMEFKKRELSKK